MNGLSTQHHNDHHTISAESNEGNSLAPVPTEVAAAYETSPQGSPHLGDTALRTAVEAPRTTLSSEDRDGLLRDKWWEGTRIANELENSLYDVFQLRLEDQANGEEQASIDVLNCSPTPLAKADIEALERTVKQVSDMTKGKIFSRIKGIVFSAGDKFKDKDLGGYVASGNYLRLNIDEVRKENSDPLAPRYQRYFKGRTDIGTFEVNVAHEMGHSIDIHTTAEAEASDVDVNQMWHPGTAGLMYNLSAFHSNVGWRHSVQDHDSGLFGKIDQWNIDDALMSEQNEYPPTSYAATDPGEDFAESFAIIALKGDTASLPIRESIVRKTIDAASGTVHSLPGRITLAQVNA